MSKYATLEIWRALENLSYHPMLVRQYWGFVGAQGDATAIKGERGIILDSSEGLKLTTAISAARYMNSKIKWADVQELRCHTEELANGETLTAWVESDRFVGECSCTPNISDDRIIVGGEGDCRVHGFGD